MGPPTRDTLRGNNPNNNEYSIFPNSRLVSEKDRRQLQAIKTCANFFKTITFPNELELNFNEKIIGNILAIISTNVSVKAKPSSVNNFRTTRL